MNVKVPTHLRGIIGKAHLRQTTGTDSLTRANAVKHKIIHELKAQIARAEEQHKGAAGSREQSRLREAMEWRQDLERAREADREDPHADHWDLTTSLLADRADEIAESEGLARAGEFHAVATGKATPITTLVDRWIAETPMRTRQQMDYRRAVTKLTAWLSAGGHPEAIEKVTQRAAGAYISEACGNNESGHPGLGSVECSPLPAGGPLANEKRDASERPS